MIEALVKESAGLIWKLAKNFYGIDKNDLYQAGVLGVIKASLNYKDDGVTKFSTYAYNYIFGEMYSLAINKDMKLNKDIYKMLKLIEKGRIRLSQEMMREPSNKELAKYLEMDLEKMECIMNYATSFISLDDGENRSLHEVIGEKESISLDDKILLQDSINNLDSLEQSIINCRYYEDLTQSETAHKLGITQVKVSRYEQRSLKKMKDYMYM